MGFLAGNQSWTLIPNPEIETLSLVKGYERKRKVFRVLNIQDSKQGWWQGVLHKKGI